MNTDLVVATPAFLDLTFVGLEALPALGEERFAGDLVRSPGGGAITAVAGARLGLTTALVAPLGDDILGEWVRARGRAGGRARREPGAHVADAADARDAVRRGSRDGHGRPRRASARGRRRRVPSPPPRGPPTSSRSHLVPDGARVYLTCGEDDARAFSGRIPARVGRAAAPLPRPPRRARSSPAPTRSTTPPRAARARPIGTVIVALGPAAPSRCPAASGSRLRASAPGRRSTRPATATALRRLRVGRLARGRSRAPAIAWAQLYAELAMSVPTATGGAVTEDAAARRGRQARARAAAASAAPMTGASPQQAGRHDRAVRAPPGRRPRRAAPPPPARGSRRAGRGRRRRSPRPDRARRPAPRAPGRAAARSILDDPGGGRIGERVLRAGVAAPPRQREPARPLLYQRRAGADRAAAHAEPWALRRSSGSG